MAHLLADENFDARITRALREFGHDVVTLPSSELAPAGTPDTRVLAVAVTTGRAVLTHDRQDYVRLHRLSAEHAGIVVASPDLDTQAAAERIHVALTIAGELEGKLLRVNLPHR